MLNVLVEVLHWDPGTHVGQFTNNSGLFDPLLWPQSTVCVCVKIKIK